MRSRVSKTRVYFPPIEVTGKVTLNFCTMGINGFVASKSDELTSRLVVCSKHSRFTVSWNTRNILSMILQPFSYLFFRCKDSKNVQEIAISKWQNKWLPFFAGNSRSYNEISIS